MTTLTVANLAAASTKSAKAPNYTEEQTAQIKAEYLANPSKDTIDALAMKMARSARSIIAKLSREGVYIKPERLTKTGEPVEKKGETAEAIGAVLRLSPEEVDSLTKANKSALKKIFAALANSKPIDGADPEIEVNPEV